jgi:hypothetical protein
VATVPIVAVVVVVVILSENWQKLHWKNELI